MSHTRTPHSWIAERPDQFLCERYQCWMTRVACHKMYLRSVTQKKLDVLDGIRCHECPQGPGDPPPKKQKRPEKRMPDWRAKRMKEKPGEPKSIHKPLPETAPGQVVAFRGVCRTHYIKRSGKDWYMVHFDVRKAGAGWRWGKALGAQTEQEALNQLAQKAQKGNWDPVAIDREEIRIVG